MARKKRQENQEAGAPLWMVTYGDLMSLLLTFFVLLLSFSTITEEERFHEAMQSFRGAVGFLPRELTMVQVNPLPKKMQRPSRSAENLARRIRRQMQVLGKEDLVQVLFDQEGELRISLPSQVLFDSASAKLKPEAFPVLNDLSAVFVEVPAGYLEIRGHTDDRPLGSTGSFRDNYDLSYARADAVARHLMQEGAELTERLEIIACGPSQPIALNTTEEGRQENRRVDITVRGLPSDEAADELGERAGQLTSAS